MRLNCILLFLTLMFTLHAEAQWTRLSETTGFAQNLCSHQGNTLVMSTRLGLFRSTDLGTSWLPAQTLLTGAGGLASDGTNLYFAQGGSGVARSTDNGVVWTNVTSGLPANGVVYTVHAGHGRMFAGLANGLYASTNGGLSWFESDSGITNLNIHTLGSKGDTVFAGATNGDLYRSTNDGSFWTDIGPSQYSAQQVSAIVVMDSTVLIGDIGPSFSPGPLRSTDWGTTWSEFSSGINEPDWGYIAGFARVDTFLFTGLYMGFANGGIFRRSSNSSWENVSNEQMIFQSGTPLRYIPAWSFASVGTTVFAGMSGNGVYRSTDLGTTWQQITSDVYGASEERLAFFSRQDTLYAGGTGSGVFISTDNGRFWNEYVRDLPSSVGGISSFAVTDSFLFEGNLTTGGVARSSNEGRRWQTVNSGLGSLSITKLAAGFNGTAGYRLLAGTAAGLYASINNGSSWSATSLGAGEVTALEVSGNTVLAARQLQVWRSSDLGVTWTRDTIGIPVSWIARAFVKAGSRWFAAGGANNSILTSTDDGVSWANVSGPITPPAWTLAAAGDTLYASNNTLVYYTTNAGQNWTAIPNNGFQGIFSIRAMMVKGGYIYIGIAGTGGAEGAWRRPVPGTTSVERLDSSIPRDVQLDQNYPNPFNPSTDIRFHIVESGMASLIVYDILGREVTTLVNETLSAGSYSVTWGAHNNEPSGVYFYRFATRGRSETRKMMLIK